MITNVEYGTCRQEIRTAYSILARILQGRSHMENLEMDGRII
jgi:hypothetical protein